MTSRHAERLREDGARLLCGVISDSAGVLRMKCVPAARIEASATAGLGASVTWAVFCVDNFVAFTDEIGVVGDLRLVPDLTGAIMLDSGLAFAPADVRTQDGDRSPLCWRDVPRRQADRLAAEGIAVKAGYEVEFTLTDRSGRPLGDEFGWPAYGLGPFLTIGDFVRAVVERLDAVELPVEQVHAEYGIGQVELSLPPQDPVRAADAVLLARTIVCQAARENDLMASFSPLPFADGAGNGAHVHLSFARDGVPLLSGGSGPAELAPEGTHLIAGIVDGLSDAVCLLAGSVVSSDRLVPGHWSGAFACWGLENREAAIRLLGATHGNPHGANVEVKCIDGSANPYLALGAILGLAADGRDRRASLPASVDMDPALLSADVAAQKRVRRLPTTGADSLELFQKSMTMRRILGEDLHGAVVAVRTHELTLLDDPSYDRIARTRFAWSA